MLTGVGRTRLIAARMVAALCAVVIVVGGTACTSGGSPNQGGPSGKGSSVLGAVLQPVEAAITEALQSATGDLQTLIITAADQVQLALDNFESAFAEDLDKTLDQISTEVRSVLTQVQKLADDLAAKTAVLLNQAIDGGQQLVNSLPFANKNPQARSFTPTLVTSGGVGNVAVHVEGNFYWAAFEKKPVTLQVGDQTFDGANLTTGVDFVVPTAKFATAAGAVSHLMMTLTAPYEKGTLFKSASVGVFKLLVAVAPASPIRAMTLTTSTVTSAEETRSVRQPSGSGGWSVDSWENCHPGKDGPHNFPVDPGWAIVGAQAQTLAVRNPAATSLAVEWTAASATITGYTKAECFLGISKGSGAITFALTYTERRTVPKTVPGHAQPVELTQWGTWTDLPVNPSDWSLHVVLWDGTMQDFRNGVDAPSKYVTVAANGANLHVQLATASAALLS